jgi:hypothetical protein
MKNKTKTSTIKQNNETINKNNKINTTNYTPSPGNSSLSASP